MTYDPSVNVTVKTYDPNTTQSLHARAKQAVREGSTDRHRLANMQWEAIENHDVAISDFQTRVRVLEIQHAERFTKEAGSQLIDEKIKTLSDKVRSVESLIWRALIAVALMMAGDIWMTRHH